MIDFSVSYKLTYFSLFAIIYTHTHTLYSLKSLLEYCLAKQPKLQKVDSKYALEHIQNRSNVTR